MSSQIGLQHIKRPTASQSLPASEMDPLTHRSIAVLAGEWISSFQCDEKVGDVTLQSREDNRLVKAGIFSDSQSVLVKIEHLLPPYPSIFYHPTLPSSTTLPFHLLPPYPSIFYHPTLPPNMVKCLSCYLLPTCAMVVASSVLPGAQATVI